MAKAIGDIVESHKLMQFFMGLNEDYDNSKDQILLMDPLPSLSKVYSMIPKVEKQRAAHVMNTESSNVTALLAM